MALDGAFLTCLRRELTAALPDARIDKIHQPGREELVLVMRTSAGTRRLYLSAQQAAPRTHLTADHPEHQAADGRATARYPAGGAGTRAVAFL